MILNLLAIAITAGIAYFWVTRGFFSALIHMVCVIAAGAVAFAVWEPLSLLLVEKMDRGFFAFVGDAGWGLGLALPFAISLGILRAIVDGVLKANAQCDDAANYAGGGICGLVSGVISAGIFVNAVSYMRVPQKFLGHQPVTVGNAGNFQLSSNLWLPVDRLTGAIYSHLSEHTLSTGTPLARLHPDLALAAGTQRMSADGGKNRNTIKREAFSVLSWFTVGKQGGNPDQVFTDFVTPGTQQINDLDGNPVSNAYSVGFVVRFDAGAREKFGQVVVSKGQFRLIAEDAAGNRTVHFPIAVTTQTRAGDDSLGRFRYLTEGDNFASVGGASEATMAFEFAVPRGSEPIALYVKNVRHDVTTAAGKNYADAASRDLDIQTGSLLGGAKAENLITDNAVPVAAPRSGDPPGLVVSAILPRSYTLQKGVTRGISIDENNHIIRGREAFAENEVGGRLDANLRVDRFLVTPDTNIVQLTVSGEAAEIPSSVTGPIAAHISATDAPRLIDAGGNIYPAVGYIYEDRTRIEISYDPSRPLRSLQDAPALSGTRDDQTLILLFRVSVSVQLQHFAVGNVVATSYTPTIEIPGPRTR